MLTQPPTEKGPALRCERKGLEDYLCDGTAVAYGEETAS